MFSTPPRTSPPCFLPYPHQFSRPLTSPTCSFSFTGWPVPHVWYRPVLSRRRRSKGKWQLQSSAQNPLSSEEVNHQPALPPDPEKISVLTAVQSMHNDILILETPESRLLLLDSTHNVHSILNKGGKTWTGSYWDDFATLPAIIPKDDSPIAIFGLGGGTAAQLMLRLWPSLRLQGWEIDDILIDNAREYLGLADLEKPTESGGLLEVRIGDALSASATVAGGYASIIVDLFSDGRVLPELEEVETWFGIKEKLMPTGRIMANCGGVLVGSNDQVLAGGRWELNDAIRAMTQAFPAGELSWKRMPNEKGANFLALTGALPDLSTWSNALPPHDEEYLRSSVFEWRTI